MSSGFQHGPTEHGTGAQQRSTSAFSCKWQHPASGTPARSSGLAAPSLFTAALQGASGSLGRPCEVADNKRERGAAGSKPQPVKPAGAGRGSAAAATSSPRRPQPRLSPVKAAKTPEAATSREQELKQAAAKARTERLRSALQQLRAGKVTQQGGSTCASFPVTDAAASTVPTTTTGAAAGEAAGPASRSPRLLHCTQVPAPVQHPTTPACSGNGAVPEVDSSLEDLFDDVSLSLLARLQLGGQWGSWPAAQQEQEEEQEQGQLVQCTLARPLDTLAGQQRPPPLIDAAREALRQAAAEEEMPLVPQTLPPSLGLHMALAAHAPALPTQPRAPAASAGSCQLAAELQQRLDQLRSSLHSPSGAAEELRQQSALQGGKLQSPGCISAASGAASCSCSCPAGAGPAVEPLRRRLAAGELVVTRAPSPVAGAGMVGELGGAGGRSLQSQAALARHSPRSSKTPVYSSSGSSAAARLASLLVQPGAQQQPLQVPPQQQAVQPSKQQWHQLQPQHAQPLLQPGPARAHCPAALTSLHPAQAQAQGQALPQSRAAMRVSAGGAGTYELSSPGQGARQASPRLPWRQAMGVGGHPTIASSCPTAQAAAYAYGGGALTLAGAPLLRGESPSQGEPGDILEAWRRRRRAAHTQLVAGRLERYMLLQQPAEAQQGGHAGAVVEHRGALLPQGAAAFSAISQHSPGRSNAAAVAPAASATVQLGGPAGQSVTAHRHEQPQLCMPGAVGGGDILEQWQARRRQQGHAAASRNADYGALLTLQPPGSCGGSSPAGSPAGYGRSRQLLDPFSLTTSSGSCQPACRVSQAALPAPAPAARPAAPPAVAVPAHQLASPPDPAAPVLAAATGACLPAAAALTAAPPLQQAAACLQLEGLLQPACSPRPASTSAALAADGPPLGCKETAEHSFLAIAAQGSNPEPCSSSGSSQGHVSRLAGMAGQSAGAEAAPAAAPAAGPAGANGSIACLQHSQPSSECTGDLALLPAGPRLPSRPPSAASSSGRATPAGSGWALGSPQTQRR